MTQEKLKQATILFKAGKKKQAGQLLLDVVKNDSNNANAWFGLALCTDDAEQKMYFVEKVLEINPEHARALKLSKKEGYTTKDIENQDNHSANEPIKFSSTNIIFSVSIGILVLCVAWLFYKVDILTESLTQTQSELNLVNNELISTQSNLSSVRSTLSSTIDVLSYVENLAKNANNYAHSHNTYSDSRLKQNVTEVEDSLTNVLSLRGVNFFWKTSEYVEVGMDNSLQIGFIAQELEKIYPELVSIDDAGYRTVDYAKLTPVLVEAIKQQQLMIEDLQQQINELQQ